METENNQIKAITVEYCCTYKGSNQFGLTDVMLEPGYNSPDPGQLVTKELFSGNTRNNTQFDVHKTGVTLNAIVFQMSKSSGYEKMFISGKKYKLTISLTEEDELLRTNENPGEGWSD